MSFENPMFLYLLVLPVILWFIVKNKKSGIEHFFSKEVLKKISISNNTIVLNSRLKVLLISLIFMVLSLARPVISDGEIKVKKQLSDLIIAIDISKSMLATDIYPNRFEFAKNKLIKILDNLTAMHIGVIGFANQSFLITPLTDDFLSLKTLVNNLNIGSINLSGTNILSAIKTANDLLGEIKNKQILLLTDGGDSIDFTNEISYANDNNIEIFIFDISTINGSTLKNSSGILKDKKGNIVIVKENLNIRELADKTGGLYQKYSLNSDDLSAFIADFKKPSTTKNLTIKRNQELFYYPLIIVILLLLLVFFSIPKTRIKND